MCRVRGASPHRDGLERSGFMAEEVDPNDIIMEQLARTPVLRRVNEIAGLMCVSVIS